MHIGHKAPGQEGDDEEGSVVVAEASGAKKRPRSASPGPGPINAAEDDEARFRPRRRRRLDGPSSGHAGHDQEEEDYDDINNNNNNSIGSYEISLELSQEEGRAFGSGVNDDDSSLLFAGTGVSAAQDETVEMSARERRERYRELFQAISSLPVAVPSEDGLLLCAVITTARAGAMTAAMALEAYDRQQRLGDEDRE